MTILDDTKKLSDDYKSWGAWRRFGSRNPNAWATLWATLGGGLMYVVRIFV